MMSRNSLRMISTILTSKENQPPKTSYRRKSLFSYSSNYSRFEYLLLGAITAICILCTIETNKAHQPKIENAFFSPTKPFSKLNLDRQPAILPTVGSPLKGYQNAFATLCVGDSFVIGTITLFHSLKKVEAKGDFVAMIYNISKTSINIMNRYGIRTYMVSPVHSELYRAGKSESIENRDHILWSKLRVWQLEEYDKVVMLDTDLIVFKNSDELFNYPEFAATPMVDKSEKISFWKSPQMGMVHRNKNEKESLLPNWSGLNSGSTVLTPSNKTFTSLMTEIQILPNRPCCPSQEFLFFFFEERKKYFRLPFVYNARLVDLDITSSSSSKKAFMESVKIYHFVGAKPWKKKDFENGFNKLWWMHFEEVLHFLNGLRLDFSVLMPKNSIDDGKLLAE